jgi:hypothetical protein
MTGSQQGFLLIADITGYTLYLSKSELEHAQGTLTALLELLIEQTRPPLVISRLAGDAVISYALRDNFLQGQTFVEMIENTYVAFRKALERLALNNTCECSACANVSALDLKFFVHYGTFGVQRLSAHDELVGSDVNLIHRLLKNRVIEKTRARAYALYSDVAIRQLAIEDISATMMPHTEEYEHLGEVKTWVQDMHPVWETKKDQARIHFPPEHLILQVEAEIQLPLEVVWDYLIQPQHFNVLAGGTRTEIAQRNLGRITVGSTYQCYHGDTIFPQTVLEWQPFERILVQVLAPIPVKNTFVLTEYRLEPTLQGTQLIQAFGKRTGPLPGRVMATLMFKMMAKIAQRDIDNFKKHVEDDRSRMGAMPRSSAITAEMVGAAAADSVQA